MKIKSFDRATVRDIGGEMALALQAVADKYGVSITRGTARFTGEEFTIKMNVAVVSPGVAGAAKSGESAQQAMFNKLCTRAGLLPEDLGTTFKRFGKELTIVGLRKTSQSYWVQLEGAKGGKWKMHAHDVLAAMGRS